jgi:anti-anti-sigma factor
MDHDILSIRVRHQPAYTIIVAAGEIDIFTVSWLRDQLFTVASDGLPLIADLDRVIFIGAAGLGALAGAARRAAAPRDQPARGLGPAAGARPGPARR